MACPRCGATVTEYAFDGRTTFGCPACGWLGVDVEHRTEPTPEVSWEEAYRRFRDRNRGRSRDCDRDENEDEKRRGAERA